MNDTPSSPNLMPLLMIGILAYVLLGNGQSCTLPGPAPKPAVVVPVELQPAVAALASFATQRTELSHFYEHFSLAVASTDRLKTLGQFRDWQTISLQAFVATEGYQGAPSVGAQIDAYLKSQVGDVSDDSRAIDAALKAKLADALKTISLSLE